MRKSKRFEKIVKSAENLLKITNARKHCRERDKETNTLIGDLYMVTERNASTLKVGFTQDLSERMYTYTTHSTVIQFIDVLHNKTVYDEKALQQKLLDMGFKRFYEDEGCEWMVIPPNMRKDMIIRKGFKIFD